MARYALRSQKHSTKAFRSISFIEKILEILFLKISVFYFFNQRASGQLTGYRVVQTGDEWDGRTFPLGGALEAVYRPGLNGVILVEVLSDRSIKIEAFQDARSLDEVTGFTEDAKTYVR